MDCRLKARMTAMVEALAREHQQELAAAGTLVDLEELTCQIGDEVTRLLTERELVRRGQSGLDRPASCPDCGQTCPPKPDPDPVILTGMRGELAYSQPCHYCDRCRRSFFPSGRAIGAARPQYRQHQGAATSGLGGKQ